MTALLLLIIFVSTLAQAQEVSPGRWRQSRDTLSVELQERIERLEALGYLAGSAIAPGLEGVTIHIKDRAWAGLNFYTSGHAPEALLMDMEGNVLHTWSITAKEVWPGRTRTEDRMPRKSVFAFWRRAYLYDTGEVLFIFDGIGIGKLDKDSNLLWANDCRAHHDIEIAPNGDIVVPMRRGRMIPRLHDDEPILDDFIALLSSSGNEKWRLSLMECFQSSDQYGDILYHRKIRHGDIFHLNTIELLDRGRALISIRNMDAIATVDLEDRKVEWAYQGSFRGQHDPTILPSGNLLLFNNNWEEGEDLGNESSVQEYDFPSMDLVWEYWGSPDAPFYTPSCGTAQRLPNRNTLITESDAGRAFEVTTEGEIVWEFYNPHRAGENRELIATLFEVRRMDTDFPLDWLEE